MIADTATAFEARLAKWEEAIAEYPGSTRGVSLMRMGIALVAWSELGPDITARAAGWSTSLLFYLVSTLMLAGCFARITTFLTACVTWYAIYQLPGTMHHHTYLMAVATTCLALTPCGGSFSVDRYLAVRDAEAKGEPIPEERGNLWALRLICLQLSAVFFWGGWDKLTLGSQSLQVGFLSGDRLEQTLLYYHSIPMHPALSFLFMLMGAGVTCFELFCGIGLWLPKTRKWCLLGCLLMTTSFQILLNVGTFGLLAAVLYLSFVPPEKIHRFVDRLVPA